MTTPKQPPTPSELLTAMVRQLDSIRKMLVFFTVVLVCSILLQACALLLY